MGLQVTECAEWLHRKGSNHGVNIVDTVHNNTVEYELMYLFFVKC